MTVWLRPKDFKKIKQVMKTWKADGLKPSEISGSAVIRNYLES